MDYILIENYLKFKITKLSSTVSLEKKNNSALHKLRYKISLRLFFVFSKMFYLSLALLSFTLKVQLQQRFQLKYL